MLVAGAVVYVGARLFAEIHVEAKALAVIAPLVLLVGAAGAAATDERRAASNEPGCATPSASVVFVAASLPPCSPCATRRSASTTARLGLERLAEQARRRVGRLPRGRPLRRLLPARHARPRPRRLRARGDRRAAGEAWQQGDAADFDSLDPGQLDKFDYAITTAAAYGSTPPPNFEPVARTATTCSGGARARRRAAEGARRRGRRPRRVTRLRPARRTAPAARRWSLPTPVGRRYTDVETPAAAGRAAVAAARSAASQAPGRGDGRRSSCPSPATTSSRCSTTRRCRSTVLFDGEVVAELPRVARRHVPERRRPRRLLARRARSAADAASTRSPSARPSPSGLAGTLGARRLVWLGDLAATRPRSRRGPCRSRGACERVRRPLRLRARRARAADAALRHPRRGAVAGRSAATTLERAPRTAKLVFVGGTGRSGTHVLSQLLSRHNRYAPGPGRGPLPHRSRRLPRPARRRGHAGAVRQADARLLVEGLSDQPLPRHVPVRRRASASTPRWRASRPTTQTTSRPPAGGCSTTCCGSAPSRARRTAAGEALVEQSTDTVAAAPTLARLFPEASFIHVVRDGRDASASRVAQTRGLVRPRTRVAGDRVVGGADPRDRGAAPTRSPTGGC